MVGALTKKREKISAAIVGATGYAGEELVKILFRHPRIKIASLSAKIDKPSLSIGKIYPFLKNRLDLKCEQPNREKISALAEVIFLAVPHTVALQMVPFFYEKGKSIIDLSADFRIKQPRIYEKWYQVKHSAPGLLKKAVYGLPELNRNKIKTARLIANPGCYPTSVILGCAPLFKAGLGTKRTIIVDAKSGFSGGGREFVTKYLPENKENLKAYKICIHRHTPEIEQELTRLNPGVSGWQKVLFVPHVIPVPRGIFSTIYVRLKYPVDSTRLRKIYGRFYANEPFVRVVDEPQIKNVVETNYCDLGLTVEPSGEYAIITVAIDNLVKGAAGQAVQNMNLMLGFPETEGLL